MKKEEEEIFPATNLLILPPEVERAEKHKRLDAKLLQSIENKFNFNSCLWINVSNHRENVQGIYDATESFSDYEFTMRLN